jgi:hypothetical protein
MTNRDIGAETSEAGAPSGEFSGDQIVDRDSRVIAYIPRPLGVEIDAELSFRQTRAQVGVRDVMICEVCVTTIDDRGIRTTTCVPIPCPKTPVVPIPPSKGPIT